MEEARELPLGADRLLSHRLSQPSQDARHHRLPTLSMDVTRSDWDCSVAAENEQHAIRMGLRMVRGLAEKHGRAVEQARRKHPFRDVTDLCIHAGLDLDAKGRECLADAGPFKGLAGYRFQAR